MLYNMISNERERVTTMVVTFQTLAKEIDAWCETCSEKWKGDDASQKATQHTKSTGHNTLIQSLSKTRVLVKGAEGDST